MALNTKCITFKCPKNASARMDTCTTCRAAIHRAEKKGVAWILMRQDILEKWQDRMMQLADRKLEAKKRIYKKVKAALPDLRIVVR